MGSTSKELREKQLTQAVADLEAMKTTLAEQGITEKAATKNPLYRQMKAAVTKARRRIHAIDDRAAHVEAMKAKDTKAEKVAKEKKAAPVAAQPAAKGVKGSKKKKK